MTALTIAEDEISGTTGWVEIAADKTEPGPVEKKPEDKPNRAARRLLLKKLQRKERKRLKVNQLFNPALCGNCNRPFLGIRSRCQCPVQKPRRAAEPGATDYATLVELKRMFKK